jgi:hypothetical protein
VDRMLVVVFDNEAKAIEGRNALLQLDNQGTILVYAWAVIVKNADQTSMVKQSDNPGPRGTLIVSCLSWKWRKRSSVKITERTYEEGTEAILQTYPYNDLIAKALSINLHASLYALRGI